VGDATSADVIVIGSGAAGLSAALTAAEEGADVIVCEKQRALGGTSNFFQGTFAVESHLQRARFITYSRDEAFKNIMEYSHWRADPRLVRAIVDESAATIAWLEQHGVQFVDVMNNMPDAPRTYHVPKGTGEAVVRALATQAKARGVAVKLAAPAKSILKQGNAVGGVVLEEDGREIEVAAGAVVIASGGYANNKEWIKKYSGLDLGVNVIPVGNVDKTGDGIRMAWESGADNAGIEVLELFRVGPMGPGHLEKCPVEYAALQPDLWVDCEGRRFCDETIGFYETSVGNASARTKQWCNYSIFDSSVVKRLTESGIDKAHGTGLLPGARLTELERDLALAVQGGDPEVLGAGSVGELAGKIGVAPATLQTTVDEYNRFCAQRHDDLFAKDPTYLRPLTGPRFYAIRARTICLGTQGGIKITDRCEVVDTKGRVIPGLYAAGYDAGGMYGDSYPIRPSSGLSSAFAINSGRIAGRNAARMERGTV
jgi:fumarate reductase flavoprotein subunit